MKLEAGETCSAADGTRCGGLDGGGVLYCFSVFMKEDEVLGRHCDFLLSLQTSRI